MFNKKNGIIMSQKLDKQSLTSDTNSTQEVEAVVPAPVERDIAKEIAKNQSFNPTVFAYTVVQLENRRYDLYKISIDPNTDASVAVKLGKNWDSENRALMEMQQHYAQDLITKRKAEARKK